MSDSTKLEDSVDRLQIDAMHLADVTMELLEACKGVAVTEEELEELDSFIRDAQEARQLLQEDRRR